MINGRIITRKQRVIDAIRHRQTDTVPYTLSFTTPEYEKVAGHLQDPDFIDHAGNHIELLWSEGGQWQELSPGVWRNCFGVVHDKTGVEKDIGTIGAPPLPRPVLDGFAFPSVDVPLLRGQLERFTRNGRDTCKFLAIGFAYYDRAWTMRGLENFMTDLLAEPAFVEELLRRIEEYNLKMIDIACEYPIDGVHLADDWGGQRGLNMGADTWRRLVKPGLKRQYDRIRKHGRIVSTHSCGNIADIFPDLIDIGLDVYQTLQPDVYDLSRVKREFGRDLAFWGGISTQQLLPFGTPDEVKRVVGETVKLMGDGGGYIASPSHEIQHDVPVENVVALIDALKNQ